MVHFANNQANLCLSYLSIVLFSILQKVGNQTLKGNSACLILVFRIK